ncbi:MAG: glycogen debranching enzyme, partial [Acidimicrobiales bacterium]
RDTVRDYWRGQDQTMPELAARLMGSSDLYEHTGRKPWASVNFVTCHDGFTMTDLVSYNEKHNEANGEGNRDGESENRSWNCGAEGPTDDVAVNSLRHRQVRNLLATLFLSQGVPMLLAGDELGRTQGGNNNGYCQDNEISWIDWEHADLELLDFVRRLGRFRARHSAFRRRQWFQGRPLFGEGVTDIAWFSPEGKEMADSDWQVSFAKTVGVYLAGDGVSAQGERSDPMSDASYFLVLNAFWDPLEFVLPDESFGARWVPVFDTAREDDPFFEDADEMEPVAAARPVAIGGRSVVVLQRLESPEEQQSAEMRPWGDT